MPKSGFTRALFPAMLLAAAHAFAAGAPAPLPAETLPIPEALPIPDTLPIRFRPLALPEGISAPLLRFQPSDLLIADSLSGRETVFREFPEYWKKVEQAEGINDLRAQLGMGRPPSLMVMTPGGLGFSLSGLVNLIMTGWEKRDARLKHAREFENVRGGIRRMTEEMRESDPRNPALSLILARVDFMGKRVRERLPDRPSRRAFTDPLRAWAENPLYTGTPFSAGLLELCRRYEEYDELFILRVP